MRGGAMSSADTPDDEIIEYKPTTEDIRAEYVANRAVRVPTTTPIAAEFDAWFANELEQAKAEALRDEAARIKETALATSFPGAVYTEHAVYRAHGCRLLLEAAERIEAAA